MSKYQSKKLSVPLNSRSQRLVELLRSDSSALAEIADAKLCNDIAIDLYNLRLRSGTTQKELAEKLGVKQSNISRWEKPGYQGYKVKMLSKIARALGSKLWISVTPPTETYFQMFTFYQNRTNKLELITPDGNKTISETRLFTQLHGFNLSMKGEGADYATV